MEQPRMRLGEILLESGILTKEQLQTALEMQKQCQLRLGTILLQEGFVSENNLLQALSRNLSIPWVSIWRIDVPDNVIALVPTNVAEEFFLFPIYMRTEKDGRRALYVAMNDPSDQDALRFVAATAGMDVKPMLAAPSDIASSIRFYYYGEEFLPEEQPDNPEVTSPKTPTPAPPEAAPIAAQVNADGEIEDLSGELDLVSIVPERMERGDITERIAPPDPKVASPKDDEPLEDAGYETTESARREAERRIYGVGRKKQVGGFALTLLDGTTLSFSKDQNSDTSVGGRLSKADLLAGLEAAAKGTPLDDFLPADQWQSYIAAMLRLLFKKGLFMYDEFMDEVEQIEKGH